MDSWSDVYPKRKNFFPPGRWNHHRNPRSLQQRCGGPKHVGRRNLEFCPFQNEACYAYPQTLVTLLIGKKSPSCSCTSVHTVAPPYTNFYNFCIVFCIKTSFTSNPYALFVLLPRRSMQALPKTFFSNTLKLFWLSLFKTGRCS
jgi:hypothetical protein